METKQLILVAVACFLLFSAMMFFLLQRISPGSKRNETAILYSSPSNNSIDVPIDGNIFVYFDNQIKNASVETEPKFSFEVSKENNSLKIKPKDFLEKNTYYKIIITSKNIKNSPYEISFKTGEEIESALKQDSALLLKIKGKIPVYSSYFDMTYIEEKNTFAIIINSKNCKTAKKSALKYLEENGVNPKNIKIKWYKAEGGNISCIEEK